MAMKIGIALGSGSARGWSHLGVLRRLAELGINPEIVTGASAGSLVGAAYASDRVDELEHWALGLTRRDIWSLLDATLGSKGGIIKGDRLMRAIAKQLPDQPIEDLAIPFGSVAADLTNGMEIWIKDGSLHQAIRASSGFPGLFAPMRYRDRWLIDGGVVNPVPVSLCRALGADFVIAVNLNHHLTTRGKGRNAVTRSEAPDKESGKEKDESEWLQKWSELVNTFISSRRKESDSPDEPGMVDVMTATINIMQNRITRSRMVGDPPDATITPNLSGFQMMDFHRAEEAITKGQESVNQSMRELEIILP